MHQSDVNQNDNSAPVWKTANRLIKPGNPLIMGILNVTPDSFSDGGKFINLQNALTWANNMIADGADIIDIGGESSRPGAGSVDYKQEKTRILPVIAKLSGMGVPISIDTSKAAIADLGLRAGGEIVNDVTGLRGDPDMIRCIVKHQAGIVIMHHRAHSDADEGRNILDDVHRYFDQALEQVVKHGLDLDHVVLDPGIGFGKTVKQNLQLIANIGSLKGYHRPILVGLSRKSFIGTILGDIPAHQRLYGSLAADMIAWLGGADIIRVHDVKSHSDFFKVANKIIQFTGTQPVTPLSPPHIKH